MWATAKNWDLVPQVDPHPIGDLGSMVGATCQTLARLLHQYSLDAGGDGGEGEPPSNTGE
jgi:hypothetical protein